MRESLVFLIFGCMIGLQNSAARSRSQNLSEKADEDNIRVENEMMTATAYPRVPGPEVLRESGDRD